jgi:hypothetical protein
MVDPANQNHWLRIAFVVLRAQISDSEMAQLPPDPVQAGVRFLKNHSSISASRVRLALLPCRLTSSTGDLRKIQDNGRVGPLLIHRRLWQSDEPKTD